MRKGASFAGPHDHVKTDSSHPTKKKKEMRENLSARPEILIKLPFRHTAQGGE